MKYLSVCSGIEAATVAWHPLGWQPFAFRAAMVLGAMLLLVSVVARHCEKNLKPELLRRKALLEQLS